MVTKNRFARLIEQREKQQRKPKSQVDAAQNRGLRKKAAGGGQGGGGGGGWNDRISPERPPAKPGAAIRDQPPEVGGGGRYNPSEVAARRNPSNAAPSGSQQTKKVGDLTVEEAFALKPEGPQQRQIPTPNGFRTPGFGSRKRSLRDGPGPGPVGQGQTKYIPGMEDIPRDELRSVSQNELDNAAAFSREPTTGRLLITDNSGRTRVATKVIGGEGSSLPMVREQSANREGLRRPNTSLASGFSEDGVPIYDNDSIRRGIESGVIPDPVAERQRIERNRAMDRYRLLNPTRKDLRVESNNPAFAWAAQQERTSTRENRPEQPDRRTIEDRAERMSAVAGPQLTAAGREVPENFNSLEWAQSYERAVQSGELPSNFSEVDAGTAQALGIALADAGTWIGGNSAPALSPVQVTNLAADMAANPDKRKFSFGNGEVNVEKLQPGELSRLELFATKAREGMLADAERQMLGALDTNNPTENVALTEQQQSLVDAQRKAEIDMLQSNLPGTSSPMAGRPGSTRGLPREAREVINRSRQEEGRINSDQRSILLDLGVEDVDNITATEAREKINSRIKELQNEDPVQYLFDRVGSRYGRT